MNPDELLAQIQELLGQYLALGEDTPVAAEAQALMAAIQGAGGGGAPPAGGEDPMAAMAAMMGGGGGAPPPDAMPMMSGNTPVPDMAGMAPEEGAAPPLDLRAASQMAEEDMLKRMRPRA